MTDDDLLDLIKVICNPAIARQSIADTITVAEMEPQFEETE